MKEPIKSEAELIERMWMLSRPRRRELLNLWRQGECAVVITSVERETSSG